MFQRCLLPLKFQPTGRHFIGEPDVPFMPRGLAIWGAPDGATVEHAFVGSRLELVCALGPVPCKFFAFGNSYEQIAKLLDQGSEPPAWCDWSPLELGAAIRITIRPRDDRADVLGPEHGLELAMWGICSVPTGVP